MNKETPALRPTTEDYLAAHQGQLDSNTEKYYSWRQELIDRNTAAAPETSTDDSSAEPSPEATSTDTELGKYYQEVVDQNEAWQTNSTDTASARELFNYYGNVDKYLQKGEEETASTDTELGKYYKEVVDQNGAWQTKPSVDENPEGLSLYEQAQRDKYLGDQYDEGEAAQSAEKSKAQQELDAARLAFAKARVDVESHFFKEWFGGKKRKEALQEAADKLKACELAVAKEEMASQIEQLNQLSGEELAKQQEVFAQMMAARAFQGMQETNQKTTEAYDEMLDQRSTYKKFAAKVGRWISNKKISHQLALVGGGAVAGAGFALTTSVGWPITTAAGLSTGAVAGVTAAAMVKQSVLEERRGEERVTDNSQDAWQDVFKQGAKDAKDAGEMMESMVDTSVDRSQKSSEERQEQLRRKVRSEGLRVMGKVALGFGIGNVAGNLAESAFSGDEVKATENPKDGGGDPPKDGGRPKSPEGSTVTQPEAPSPVGSYEYPWDWAVGQFGAENATSELHRLADLAQANGHEVEWIVDGSKEILKVDGSFDTGNIIGVLDQYRHVLAA